MLVPISRKNTEPRWIESSSNTLTRYVPIVCSPFLRLLRSHGSFPVDATDSKGEPIHQTLMAKKMQRLDESPDFRPFKFRIQAFTHGFLEEVWHFLVINVFPALNLPSLAQLSRQGYPEEKIPMKKVKSPPALGHHITNVRIRSATICGNSNTSFDSMKMGKKPNPKGIIFGTLKPKRLAMANGNSVLSIVSSLEIPQAWLTVASNGPGLPESGILKHRSPIFLFSIVPPRYRRGSVGRMTYYLESLLLMPRAAKSLSSLRYVFLLHIKSFASSTI